MEIKDQVQIRNLCYCCCLDDCKIGVWLSEEVFYTRTNSLSCEIRIIVKVHAASEVCYLLFCRVKRKGKGHGIISVNWFWPRVIWTSFESDCRQRVLRQNLAVFRLERNADSVLRPPTLATSLAFVELSRHYQIPFQYQLNEQDLLYTYIWCVSATCFGVCTPSSWRTIARVLWKTNYYCDIFI